MSIENIKVPDLGDASEVEVIELLVSVGQTVAENDSLLVLESDKAAMEIPAPMAGVVKSIFINLGDQLSTGSEMLSLEVESGEEAEEETNSEPVEAEQTASKTKAVETESELQKPELKEPELQEPELVEQQTATTEGAEPAGTMTSTTIEVPDLGADDEVEVIEIHVKVGESVAIDDALITLESDKAAMDVPSPQAGTIESLLVVIGDKLKTGSPIVQLLSEGPAPATTQSEKTTTEPAAEESKPQPLVSPQAGQQERKADQPSTEQQSQNQSKVYAGPAVRKLARELGVELQLVQGSGAKSRILKEDLHEFVKSRMQSPAGQPSLPGAVPDIDFSQFGEIEQLPRSKLHKLIAVNMHRNWTAIPHVAQFNEADITDLEEFRAELKPEAERKGIKLTLMPFLLKACAKALTEYPQFNVSLHSSGEIVIQKKYVHIGMAVATDAGLVVPVIRNVDQKTIWQLAAEVIELSDKAKQRKLKIEEMQGACFTISSLGAIGGTGFIPIVNAPEVAILGVAKTQIKPVYQDGEFLPRKILPITLSYDHKAVNGVDGGLFASYLAKLLADVRYLIL